MNPRMSIDWLRYLVTVGANHDEDGWRWKLDPTMRFGGFGPWRPEWSMLRLPGLGSRGSGSCWLGAGPFCASWARPALARAIRRALTLHPGQIGSVESIASRAAPRRSISSSTRASC